MRTNCIAFICIALIGILPAKAQRETPPMEFFFYADVVKETVGGKPIDYTDLRKPLNVEMLTIGDELVLKLEYSKNPKASYSSSNIEYLFFSIWDLTIDWLDPISQEGIIWEGYAFSKQVSNTRFPFTMILYPKKRAKEAELSIRIGENLRLCNNFQNINMNKLVALSHIKDNSYNISSGKVIFKPQNAIVVDAEGSHNFTSYDCSNMNVEDKKATVDIAWGGDKVTLHRSSYNEDTYTATGNSSRGKVTVTAYRSSASGKIYLVTAAMSNPTPDVHHITINFKP